MKSSAIPLRYGVILGIILIAYFWILSVFDLHTYVWFSLLNAVFTSVAVFLATKDFKIHKQNFKYHKGFVAGLKTGFLGTLIFTVFFAVYASNIDPNFIDQLLVQYNVNYNSELALVIFTVGMMGVVTTFIATLSCMQLFKDSWNTHHPHPQKMASENI